MRKTLFCLLVLLGALSLSGCAETVGYSGSIYGTYHPEEVYSYPTGCWADGIWYAPCRWSPGVGYGYYRYDGLAWGYYPSHVWPYRPGFPPPHQWYGGHVNNRGYNHGYYPAHPTTGPRNHGPSRGGGGGGRRH